MKKLILLLLCSHSILGSNAQFINGTACDNPSFSATTIYTFFQPMSKFSIGGETGYWHGEADPIYSFFFGMYLIKMDSITDKKQKVLTQGANFSLYEKTQLRIIPNYLYAEISPEMVNLSKFDVRGGLRLTIPIGYQLGISIEGGYAYIQKQYYGVFNVHIAFD